MVKRYEECLDLRAYLHGTKFPRLIKEGRIKNII